MFHVWSKHVLKYVVFFVLINLKNIFRWFLGKRQVSSFGIWAAHGKDQLSFDNLFNWINVFWSVYLNPHNNMYIKTSLYLEFFFLYRVFVDFCMKNWKQKNPHRRCKLALRAWNFCTSVHWYWLKNRLKGTGSRVKNYPVTYYLWFVILNFSSELWFQSFFYEAQFFFLC